MFPSDCQKRGKLFKCCEKGECVQTAFGQINYCKAKEKVQYGLETKPVCQRLLNKRRVDLTAKAGVSNIFGDIEQKFYYKRSAYYK